MVNLEGEYLKVKLYAEKIVYDSHIPVYTCRKCKLKWALERVVNSKPQTHSVQVEND